MVRSAGRVVQMRKVIWPADLFAGRTLKPPLWGISKEIYFGLLHFQTKPDKLHKCISELML